MEHVSASISQSSAVVQIENKTGASVAYVGATCVFKNPSGVALAVSKVGIRNLSSGHAGYERATVEAGRDVASVACRVSGYLPAK